MGSKSSSNFDVYASLLPSASEIKNQESSPCMWRKKLPLLKFYFYYSYYQSREKIIVEDSKKMLLENVLTEHIWN